MDIKILLFDLLIESLYGDRSLPVDLKKADAILQESLRLTESDSSEDPIPSTNQD